MFDADSLFDADNAWLQSGHQKVLLRGVNICGSAKTNLHRIPEISDAQLNWLGTDIGLNAVRLPVFWDALEPREGQISPSYLEGLRDLIARVHRARLRVVLCMHQDVYGPRFGFAGFPDWTISTTRRYQKRTPWHLSYFEPAVMDAFDDFWSQLSPAFARAWGYIAEATSDLSIFGFDLMNEPFWGSQNPSVVESLDMPRCYQRCMDAIGTYHDASYFLLEPLTTSNVGLPSHLPDNRSKRVGFAPHFYPPAVEIGLGYEGDATSLRRHLSTQNADAKRIGPLVIGEFGARRSVPGALAFVGEALDLFDEVSASAFLWEFDGSYGIQRNGQATPLSSVLRHPYPSDLAGKDAHWSSREGFALRFVADEGETWVKGLDERMELIVVDGDAQITKYERGHCIRTAAGPVHIKER